MTNDIETAAPGAATQSPDDNVEFLDKEQLLKRLPFSSGTLSNRMKAGVIPYIRDGRRVLFFWPDVKESLRRRQRGGCQ